MTIWPWKQSEGHRETIDLGRITPLRFAQHQQWHDLLIAGPTRSVANTTGNDFPGLYYYDPRTQTEYVLMFEGEVDWHASRLERRVAEVRGDDECPHLLVGLFSEKRLDESVKLHRWENHRLLLKGESKEDRDAMPDQWEALATLTRESFRLLKLPKAGPADDWKRTAARCLKTLCDRGKAQEENRLWIFFETFATEGSRYEPKPDKAYTGTAELICQAGLASSLLSYAKMNPPHASVYEGLGRNLEAILHTFYDNSTDFFQNTYPPKGEEWTRGVVDTWYTMHNLYHVLRASHLAQDTHLEELACKAIDRAISFVRASQYQIPLFAKIAKESAKRGLPDGAVIGFALNPSVLGMYAMILCYAATIVKRKKYEYRDEAAEALGKLRRWPIAQLFHQTVQLSWAAWASHELGLREWRDDFTRCLLLSCYRQGKVAGLFQGCAGLQYPAFRETVEAVVPWVRWIEEAPEDLPLRQIIDLVLDRARQFISGGKHAGLPQEGLPTKEQPDAGEIGVAIYAAPQVFELAGLQRRLRAGRAAD